MSQYAYDATDWLVSATRALEDYVTNTLDDDNLLVEMSFPNTAKITKESPLPKALIHFETDDIANPVLGFGQPGQEVLNEVDATWELHEAAKHHVNFDVGVWCSAENGGATKRMQLYSALSAMFATSLGRVTLNETTGGVKVIQFSGGRFALDRINDLPIWRALEMTLVVEVFSKHVPAEPEVLTVEGVDQAQTLTIDGNVPVEE